MLNLCRYANRINSPGSGRYVARMVTRSMNGGDAIILVPNADIGGGRGVGGGPVGGDNFLLAMIYSGTRKMQMSV